MFHYLLAANSSFLATALLFSTLMGLAMLALLARRRIVAEDWSKPALAALLCIYLQLFQNAFSLTTSNAWEECVPFVGLIFGGACGLIWLLFEQQLDPRSRVRYGWYYVVGILGLGCFVSFTLHAHLAEFTMAIFLLFGFIVGMFAPPWQVEPGTGTAPAASEFHGGVRRGLLVVLVGTLLVGCGIQGIRSAWLRSVHDLFANAEFRDVTPIEGLERLKWGKPTLILDVDYTYEDLTKVVDRLKSEGKPFFVFPEFILLYGVVGTPSPQPLLWFHKGLTYPSEYDESLDRWMVDSLIAANVELVVLQETCFFGANMYTMTDFPLLKDFINRQFVFDERFGAFKVWRKKHEEE